MMRLLRLLKLLLVLPAFFLLQIVVPARAQNNSSFKLDIDVDLTELDVSVTDEQDRPVGNLGKENFRVFEDSKEQTISIFRHEDVAVSIGLVVDNSRSMEP